MSGQRSYYHMPDGGVFVAEHPFYLASCDCCGWYGSSDECDIDLGCDDSDVYCPECGNAGADFGKFAASCKVAPGSPSHD